MNHTMKYGHFAIGAAAAAASARSRNPLRIITQLFWLLGKGFSSYLVLSVAAFLPWYLWIEVLYRYLNPENPPVIDELLAFGVGNAVMVVPVLLWISCMACSAAAEITGTLLLLAGTIETTKRQKMIWKQGVAAARTHARSLFLFSVVLIYSGIMVAGLLFYFRIYRNKLLLLLIVCMLFVTMLSFMATIPILVLEQQPVWRAMLSSTIHTAKNGLLLLITLSVVTVSLFGVVYAAYQKDEKLWGPSVFLFSSWIAWALWNILSVTLFFQKQHTKDHEHASLTVTTFPQKRHHSRSSSSVADEEQATAASSTSSNSNSIPSTSRKRNRFAIWRLLQAIAIGFVLYTMVLLSPWHGRAVLYSPATDDYAGSQIAIMLMHHAYAHSFGYEYGGHCAPPEQATGNKYIEQTHKSVHELGYESFLPWACPEQQDSGWNNGSIQPTFLPWAFFHWIVTDSWIEFVQLHVTYPEKDPNVFTIVVHIRRDDVSPCRAHRAHRYLTNQYYLEIIDQYMPSPGLLQNRRLEVIIHAQAKEVFVTKVETLDVFRERNFTLKLDNTPFTEVWGDMMTADVFIMSRSLFSAIPALLNRYGTVVYPRFVFFPKLPQWQAAGSEVLRRVRADVQGLKPKCKNHYPYTRTETSGVLRLLRFGPARFYEII